MNWPIPAQWRHYKEKAAQYCSHLLGHEGEGSLYALLKKKGWATALVTGPGNISSDFEIFKVSIELTEEGFGTENYFIFIIVWVVNRSLSINTLQLSERTWLC